MNLTIFGAGGRTGQHLVRQALAAGHDVTAFVHSAGKFETDQGRITEVAGDVREPTKVADAIEGADAVISVLGPSGNQEAYAISTGMRNIIDAMNRHDVERLVVSVGAGVGDPKDEPRLIDKAITLLLKLTSRHVYEDMKQVAEIVRTSDLDWTMARAPRLTDEAGGQEIRVGYLGGDVGTQLSRQDFALFILQQVDDDTYVHAAPVISN
jgi:putative NADH-flavin reductase